MAKGETSKLLNSSDIEGEDEHSERGKLASMLNRTTDSQTMTHILKANVGTGVLAMPNAFKDIGLWPGLILVPIIGVICIHCMNILIASHNILCDRFNFESLDYDQVAALSLACGPKRIRPIAKRAQLIVTIFLLLTQIGFCCVYVKFVVENVRLAMLNLFQLQYSTTSYLLILFPVIWLTSCTSNLKHLSRISAIANILQLLGLSLILYDLLMFHTYGVGEDQIDNVKVDNWPSSLDSLARGLPLFFATAVYAFEGIGVVLPLIKEMQYPEHISGLNGVLNTSMMLVGILYMAIGFFGYAKYGQFVGASITLNLPVTKLNEIVRLMFALGIGLSYSLQFYVPWTIIWPIIDESLFYSYRPRFENHIKKRQFLSKLESGAAGEWQATCSSNNNNTNTVNNLNTGNKTSNGEEDNEQDYQSHNDASIASTFATSYLASMAVQQQHQQQHQQQQTVKSRRNRLDDVNEQEDDDQIPEMQWRPPPRSMRGNRKLVRYTVISIGVSITCK